MQLPMQGPSKPGQWRSPSHAGCSVGSRCDMPAAPQVRHLAEHPAQLPQWRQWRPSLMVEEASYEPSSSGQVGDGGELSTAGSCCSGAGHAAVQERAGHALREASLDMLACCQWPLSRCINRRHIQATLHPCIGSMCKIWCPAGPAAWLTCVRPCLQGQQQDQQQEGVLKLTGYVRGVALSADQLVTIPGLGDFQIQQIQGPPDPWAPSHKGRGDHDMQDSEPVVLALPSADQDQVGGAAVVECGWAHVRGASCAQCPCRSHGCTLSAQVSQQPATQPHVLMHSHACTPQHMLRQLATRSQAPLPQPASQPPRLAFRCPARWCVRTSQTTWTASRHGPLSRS